MLRLSFSTILLLAIGWGVTPTPGHAQLFSRGDGYNTNTVSTNSIPTGATNTLPVLTLRTVDQVAIGVRGVLTNSETANLIVEFDASVDSNLWVTAWRSWTNAMTGTTTNFVGLDLDVGTYGYVRPRVRNTATNSPVNGFSFRTATKAVR
jgi:hypothetical protein